MSVCQIHFKYLLMGKAQFWVLGWDISYSLWAFTLTCESGQNKYQMGHRFLLPEAISVCVSAGSGGEGFSRDGTWIGLGDELDGHLQTEMMAGRKAGDPRSFRRPNGWRSFKQRAPGSWVFFKGYMEISRGDEVESFPSLTDVNMHSCQFSTLAPRILLETTSSKWWYWILNNWAVLLREQVITTRHLPIRLFW